MGGCDQTTHIHGGGRREIDPVGIAQIHLARCCDAAKNLAGVRIVHAVQCDGLCVRLRKMDTGRLADIKTVPIQHGPLTGLCHYHVGSLSGSGLADAGVAANHSAARG